MHNMTINYTKSGMRLLRVAHAYHFLLGHGLSTGDVLVLRRAERTLHRWDEALCNGAVQVEEDTGQAYRYDTVTGKRTGKTANVERKVWARAQAVAAKSPTLQLVRQSDPRGAALHFTDRDGRTIYLPD